MYLPDTKSMALQTNYGSKQHNLLNVNNLGCDVTYYVIHSKYSYTTFSDATQWHLTDLSCPCRIRLDYPACYPNNRLCDWLIKEIGEFRQ